MSIRDLYIEALRKQNSTPQPTPAEGHRLLADPDFVEINAQFWIEHTLCLPSGVPCTEYTWPQDRPIIFRDAEGENIEVQPVKMKEEAVASNLQALAEASGMPCYLHLVRVGTRSGVPGIDTSETSIVGMLATICPCVPETNFYRKVLMAGEAKVKDAIFPPPLKIGVRVWTEFGFKDHGASRVNIAPSMGGTIKGIETVPTPDANSVAHLYTVNWDNGQQSKHYSSQLTSIGRFNTLAQFRDAIRFTGKAKVLLGPRAGFRKAIATISYDSGPAQEVTIDDGCLWKFILEPLVKRDRVRIATSIVKKTTE